MSEPMSDTTAAAPPPTASGNAVMILVLGILGIICCNLLGPVAWYMGKKELDGIAEGRISAADESTTKVGMILGIVGTVLLGLALLWMFFFGGMAVLSALFGRH